MKFYNTNNRIGTHTCRITLMYKSYVGHVTFNIGGNCHGLSILNSALDYLEDPGKCESDCSFECYDNGFYSLMLCNGFDVLDFEDIDYDELMDMIVAVEIVDYKPRKEEDDDDEEYE